MGNGLQAGWAIEHSEGVRVLKVEDVYKPHGQSCIIGHAATASDVKFAKL